MQSMAMIQGDVPYTWGCGVAYTEMEGNERGRGRRRQGSPGKGEGCMRAQLAINCRSADTLGRQQLSRRQPARSQRHNFVPLLHRQPALGRSSYNVGPQQHGTLQQD